MLILADLSALIQRPYVNMNITPLPSKDALQCSRQQSRVASKVLSEVSSSYSRQSFNTAVALYSLNCTHIQFLLWHLSMLCRCEHQLTDFFTTPLPDKVCIAPSLVILTIKLGNKLLTNKHFWYSYMSSPSYIKLQFPLDPNPVARLSSTVPPSLRGVKKVQHLNYLRPAPGQRHVSSPREEQKREPS